MICDIKYMIYDISFFQPKRLSVINKILELLNFSFGNRFIRLSLQIAQNDHTYLKFWKKRL
jgi:hypothetical protein